MFGTRGRLKPYINQSALCERSCSPCDEHFGPGALRPLSRRLGEWLSETSRAARVEMIPAVPNDKHLVAWSTAKCTSARVSLALFSCFT
mgnify:CR=1 FL=1